MDKIFTKDMEKELGKKLDRSNVKSRKQGGVTVSYVDNHHVISEANRIFGHDGWTRETIDIRPVSEKVRKIGQQQHDGWGVSYIARVKVTVHGVVREGCGAGHGIDRDLGQAHESAIKEAETDAMKRALMTFGNTFGLALYDKTQSDVGVEPEVMDSKSFALLGDEINATRTMEEFKIKKSKARSLWGNMDKLQQSEIKRLIAENEVRFIGDQNAQSTQTVN